MTNKYSNFYLYAKGWYPQSNDIWRDIFVILEDYSGVHPTTRDALVVLSHIVEECIFNKIYGNPAYAMRSFHGAMRTYITKNKNDYDTAYLRAALTLMNMAPTGDDLLDEKYHLSEPDVELFGSIVE